LVSDNSKKSRFYHQWWHACFPRILDHVIIFRTISAQAIFMLICPLQFIVLFPLPYSNDVQEDLKRKDFVICWHR
jgi:hypothetical protein